MKSISEFTRISEDTGGSGEGWERSFDHETQHLSPENKQKAKYHHDMIHACDGMCVVKRGLHHAAEYKKLTSLKEGLDGGTVSNPSIKAVAKAADPKEVVKEDKLVGKTTKQIGGRGRTATGQKANKINTVPRMKSDMQRRLEVYRKRGQ